MMSPQRVHKLVENLMEGEEDLFFAGLKQELSTRKEDLCKSISIKIFENLTTSLLNKSVNENEDIKKLINLLTELNKNKKAKIEFKNGSIINISESEIAPLKLLFDQLNDKNQKHLAKNIFETPNFLRETIQFAKNTKGLLT
jgi:hypothetical protein